MVARATADNLDLNNDLNEESYVLLVVEVICLVNLPVLCNRRNLRLPYLPYKTHGAELHKGYSIVILFFYFIYIYFIVFFLLEDLPG